MGRCPFDPVPLPALAPSRQALLWPLCLMPLMQSLPVLVLGHQVVGVRLQGVGLALEALEVGEAEADKQEQWPRRSQVVARCPAVASLL